MPNEELEEYLRESAIEQPPAQEPEPAPPAAEATPAQAEPDDDDIPTPQEGEPTVPRRALEDERRKRQDYKDRAARAEVERDMLAKQIEELKRAQQPAQPYQPPAPINPVEDPQGFITRTQEVMLNERLNTSELMARDKLGDEAVEAAQAEFKQMAQEDPSLFQKLYSQPHPYGWMMKEVERRRVAKEIGEDPAAYRSRIEAEIRAKVLAEVGAAPAAPAAPRVSPAAGLSPSLANVRSSAPRASSEWTQAPSASELFPN